MNQKLNGVLQLTIYLAQMLSLGIFTYLIVAQLLSLFAVEQAIDPRAFEREYLRFLIAVGLTTATISAALLIVIGKIKRVKFFSLPRREQITYLFIATSLGYFFSTDKYLSPGKEILIFFPVFAVLLIVIPNLIESFVQYNVLEYGRILRQFDRTKRGLRTSVIAQVVSIAIAVIVLGINAGLVMLITTDYISGNTARETELRRTVYIKRANPTRTTQAERVVLHGYNLGWNRDGRSKVKSNAGEIQTGVWNNTEVEFEIPLHVEPGTWQFWVHIPKDDGNEKSPMITSNKVSVEIAPRFEYYPRKTDNIVIRQWKKMLRFLFL